MHEDWFLGHQTLKVEREGLDAGLSTECDSAVFDCGVIDAGNLNSGPVDAGPTHLRVLFVGNSYTSVNDLPAMLSQMAQTSGEPPSIEVDSVILGGATLADHWYGRIAPKRIREGAFDFVVLQGESLEAINNGALMGTAFDVFASRFGALAVDAGAVPTR